MDRGLHNRLVIVQHRHQGLAPLRQAIDQRREHRLPGGLRAIVEGRKGKPREPGLALFQCCQHISPELKGRIITRVKRDPGHRWVVGRQRANPASQQCGLAKARSGRNENKASVESGIEQGQQMWASNDLMGGDGEQQFGHQQRIRRRAWDGLGRVAVGPGVLAIHDSSSFLAPRLLCGAGSISLCTSK